ncbi:MAG: hypothetical protein ABI307_06560, partial [Mycobacterium sp.]
ETGISKNWAATLDGLGPEATITTRAYTGRLARGAATPHLTAWTKAGAPRPAPYPDQMQLVREWRAGGPNSVDPESHWAGQSAALGTEDPAGDVVARMWDEASNLLP